MDGAEQGAGGVVQGFELGPADRPIYQAGAFFPMPVVAAISRDATGQLNVAPYSLCFPQPEQGPRALLLISLRDSNTWQNVVATGRVTLCFLPDEPGMLERCLALSKAMAPAEKMAQCGFSLVQAHGVDVLAEAEQAFACQLRRHEDDAASGQRRMYLEVEQVLLPSRWAQSLRRGFGAPRMAVEFGFRGRGAGWISRPQVHFSGAALRPRFTINVKLDPDEVTAALQRALEHEFSGVEGFARDRHAQINIPAAEHNFWSPELQIEVEPAEGGAQLIGKIGPHSRVWTMFMMAHGAIAISAGFGVLFGLSQWMLDQPPTGLLAIPAALLLHAFVAGAAFIGQGLGADHTFRLREFVQDALSF